MTTTEIVLALAGLALAVGAICYWRAGPERPVGETKWEMKS